MPIDVHTGSLQVITSYRVTGSASSEFRPGVHTRRAELGPVSTAATLGATGSPWVGSCGFGGDGGQQQSSARGGLVVTAVFAAMFLSSWSMVTGRTIFGMSKSHRRDVPGPTAGESSRDSADAVATVDDVAIRTRIGDVDGVSRSTVRRAVLGPAAAGDAGGRQTTGWRVIRGRLRCGSARGQGGDASFVRGILRFRPSIFTNIVL